MARAVGNFKKVVVASWSLGVKLVIDIPMVSICYKLRQYIADSVKTDTKTAAYVHNSLKAVDVTMY